MARPLKMASILDTNFGDEEDDEEEFNPSPEPARAKDRPARPEAEDDNGEDEEGEGEDLHDDEEDEDDDDDDDDEEAVSSRPRKRRRKGLNQFFEEEAEVDEDDDDAEDDGEDLVADGFVADTHPDDLDELGPGVERDDRAHRLLDARLDLEASMDAERQAQELKERYGRRTQTGLSANSFVPQNLLMPSVDDPSIWGISCKVGKEREIIMKIMKKFEDRSHSRNPMRICSAFERGSGPMAGYIFVEARKKADVDDALTNIADVYPRTKTNLVPVKEMPDLLRVTKTQELREDGYVRIKRGLYKDDLAMIQEVESNGLEVTVRLVPRLTYGLDEDDSGSPMAANTQDGQAKRKRMNAFGASNSSVNRPPQRLFNEGEARKRHSKFTTPGRPMYGGKAFNYKGDLYEDGFLIKEYKLQHLITQDVNPRLDEITKLTRTMADGTEALDLESLAHSLRNNTAEGSYMPGDEVEVYEGEQRGITGRTEAVQGNIVSIKVTEGELRGQVVDVPMKGLRKRFKEGDHVKVIGGSRYRDEVGMVIRIKDDRVTVLTDLSMTEITVFSKDLREATDSGGSMQANKFDVQDLLQLDPSTVGIVIKADRESIRVLDQDGSVSMRLPSQITNKIEVRRNAVGTDKNGAEIRIGDVVREAGGEGKTGTLLHIHRSYVFLHNKTQVENSGLWTTRSMNVITTANKGGKIGAPSVDMTKMNPALQLKNGGMPDMPPPRSGFDRLRGKKISIRKGPYKGHKGTVKDTTDTTARIELEAKSKVVNVPKDDLNIIEYVFVSLRANHC
jgi:transcription elongation factor SPT5